MLSTVTQRPRNIDTKRAAALLYGDLGTSKAYVIGLALAIAGYSSFWFILAVSILTIIIGINYCIICKYYPNGGGVYASVRRRSEFFSLFGAFFLFADYLVTAALSALSAFHYLNVADPVLTSVLVILLIGCINYFGPRHSGTLAFIVGVTAVALLTILAVFSLPYLKMAWHNIQPLHGKPWTIWNHFVGVIVALSGIEAIANITGIMKLNKEATREKPKVTKVSTKAILVVVTEVALFTAFFSFVASAFGDFQFGDGELNAPGYPNVRDSLLRFLAQNFAGNVLGETLGHTFAWFLSIAVGILLLSAVNTAINGLVSLQYLMASDGEFPKKFEKINRYGVPILPLAIATIIPILLVLVVKNVAGLATLYAVGFVGAIATNLGATSTDFSLPLKWHERSLMCFSALIMICIEITLFMEKPHARYYALAIMISGLILRAFAQKKVLKEGVIEAPIFETPVFEEETIAPSKFSLLLPVTKKSKALDWALQKSIETNAPLHLLYIREQSVISENDLTKNFENDIIAFEIQKYALTKHSKDSIYFHYCITDSALNMIAAYAMRFEISEIIVERPSKKIVKIIKGDLKKKLKLLLPEETIIIVI